MTNIELPYTATFNAIGDAVEQSANGIGISVKAFQEAFQPTLRAIVSQACAAEIEAAREEGRRAGMMEAAQVAWRFNVCDPWASKIAAAIEAKAKEDL